MYEANNPRCFASLNMTEDKSFMPGITTISSFAPGTGIVSNRNYPACKSLRRSGAALVDARSCAEILFGGDHFQKDASQRFRLAGSIIAPAAWHILSKAVCLERRKFL